MGNWDSVAHFSNLLAAILPVSCLGFWLYMMCSDHFLSRKSELDDVKDLLPEDY